MEYFRSRKSNIVHSHAAFYFPDNIKTNSKPSRPLRRKEILPKTPDILTVPPLNSHISLVDTMPAAPPNDQSDILPNFYKLNLNGNSTDSSNESIPQISTKIQQLPHMNQMVNYFLFQFRFLIKRFNPSTDTASLNINYNFFSNISFTKIFFLNKTR